MTPKVTIGLPYFNNAATLADAIRSVLSQSFQEWELLLLDDGSTDGSSDIAKSVKDPRVRTFSDGVNRGLVHRLNQIAQLACGKYLARMDGDDLMHPERLAKQAQYLESHPDVDLVDTAMYSMDQAGNPVGIRGMSPLHTEMDRVLEHGMMIHATVVGRRDWFRNNPYDPHYVRAEDHELWCRTCQFSKFGRVMEPLYFVREGRIRVKNYSQAQKTERLIYKKYGPAAGGRARTTLLMLASFLKEFVYVVFGLLGCHDILVNQRNRKLALAERQAAKLVIADIQTVNISTGCLSPKPLSSTVQSREG